jgi:hypothetical protein
VKCGRKKIYLGFTKQEGKLDACSVQQKASYGLGKGTFVSTSEAFQNKKLFGS